MFSRSDDGQFTGCWKDYMRHCLRKKEKEDGEERKEEVKKQIKKERERECFKTLERWLRA